MPIQKPKVSVSLNWVLCFHVLCWGLTQQCKTFHQSFILVAKQLSVYICIWSVALTRRSSRRPIGFFDHSMYSKQLESTWNVQKNVCVSAVTQVVKPQSSWPLLGSSQGQAWCSEAVKSGGGWPWSGSPCHPQRPQCSFPFHLECEIAAGAVLTPALRGQLLKSDVHLFLAEGLQQMEEK